MHNCEWCFKKYTTRGKLKIHIKNHHPLKLQEFMDSVSQCPHCGIKYDTYAKLGGHLTWCGISEDTKKLYKSKLSRGHPVTPETKQKLSVIRSKYLEEVGGGGFTTIQWYTVSNIYGEEFVVRGSWELAVAEWLNDNKIGWVRKTYLTYEKDGIKKTYCPDFYIKEYDIYLEVKGYFSQTDKYKLSKVVLDNNISLKLVLSKDIKLIKSNKFTVNDLLKIKNYSSDVVSLDS